MENIQEVVGRCLFLLAIAVYTVHIYRVFLRQDTL